MADKPVQEVACNECGLDPMCQVLDYSEQGSGVPPGVLSRRQLVQKGEMLFSADQPFEAVYAAKSGSFKAMVSDVGRGERVVGFFLAGDLIGAEGIANQCYSYGVRALEQGSVCMLQLARLEETGRSIEVLQRALIEMLGHEVALNHLLTSSLMQQNAEQRLAAFIISLSNRMATRGLASDRLWLSMSRSDIASYLGLARETVSRVLTRFQNAGLIGLRKHYLKLLNRRGLERVAFARWLPLR
ncbi:MAG: helix-turn-helix domain-containing protein [Candidatus Thiodiazotropha sp. (ex Epidulcina cf. delphinae)]|nr:helix-turn-helix domain-containing protein [Candidatus Thiodiazotropha sp. (ex Epidulcina cf. delphinae)]